MGNKTGKPAELAFQAYLSGDYEQSKHLYEKLILESEEQQKRDASLYHDFARLMENGIKDFAKASKYYLLAIECCSGESEVAIKSQYCGNYAQCLRSMKEFKLSEDFFLLCMELKPDDIHYMANYADLLRVMGKLKDSRVQFNKCIVFIEEENQRMEEYNLSHHSGDGSSAEEKRDSKFDYYANKKSRHSNKASNTNTNANTNNANTNANQQTITKQKSNSLLLQRSLSHGSTGHLYQRSSAIDSKLTKLAIEESNLFTKKSIGKIYNNFALLLFEMKCYEEASTYYELCIDMDEYEMIRHYNFARLLYDMQSWTQALKHLEIALELSKTQGDPHANTNWLYARLNMDLHRFEVCEEHFQKAISIQPKNPLFRCDLILFFCESKQFPKCLQAMKAYKQALNIQYTYFDLVYTVFIAKQGKKEQATKNFELLLASDRCPADNALSINSRFAYFYYYAWFNHYILSDFKKGIKYYDLIIKELRPKSALTYYHYSVCLISKYIFARNVNKNIAPRMSALFRTDVQPSPDSDGHHDNNINTNTNTNANANANANAVPVSQGVNLLAVHGMHEDHSERKNEVDIEMEITDDDMEKDFEFAWTLLQKSKLLNPKLPAIVKYFAPLKQKIEKVISLDSVYITNDEDTHSVKAKAHNNSSSGGFKIVIGDVNISKSDRGGVAMTPRGYETLQEENENENEPVLEIEMEAATNANNNGNTINNDAGIVVRLPGANADNEEEEEEEYESRSTPEP